MQEGQKRFEAGVEDRFKRLEVDIAMRVNMMQFHDRSAWADERYTTLTKEVAHVRMRVHDVRNFFTDFLLTASQAQQTPPWIRDVLDRVEERAKEREAGLLEP